MTRRNKKVTMKKTGRSNGGFTIVELLISIAIMLIVSSAIFSFMIYSSKFFNKASTETDLQQEAQIMKNQMNNLITDTAKGIKYVEASADADKPYGAKKCLTIFGEKSVAYLAWMEEEKEVYFIEKSLDNIQQGEDGEYDIYFSEQEKNALNWSLMAEYVSGFSCNLSEVTDKHQIFTCNLEFELSETNYTTTHTITLRNRISSDKEIKDLYQDYVSPVEDLVTDVLLTPYMADAVPGEQVQFHATVVAVGTPNKEVTYEVKGSKSDLGATNISQDGILTVGKDEESPTLTIICRSVHDSAISSFALVNVARIEGVTVKCLTPPPYMSKFYFANNYVDFSAMVEGDFITEDARRVKWEIENSYPAGAVGTAAQIISSTDTTCRINTGTIIGNNITVKAIPLAAVNPEKTGKHELSVAEMEMGEMYIEAVGGYYEVDRGGNLQLNAYINGEGEHSGISFIWEIVKDPTNGRISINPNTGLVTADRGIPFNKEYKVTIKATARDAQGTGQKSKTCDVAVKPVSISFDPESAIVVLGSSTTVNVKVTGLVDGENALSISQKPPVLNFSVVKAKGGKLKLGCSTDNIYRKTTTVIARLKDSNSVSAELPVYFKENNISIPGVYAPMPGDEFFPDSDNDNIPDQETSKVILNGVTFVYEVVNEGNKKVWYLYIEGIESANGKRYSYNSVNHVYELVQGV